MITLKVNDGDQYWERSYKLEKRAFEAFSEYTAQGFAVTMENEIANQTGINDYRPL